jgi:hypothetical protein
MNVTLTRILRAAVVATLLVPVAAPAFAGPAETKYLETLAGTWTGKGKITGAENGSVACRLTVKPSGEKLNFNGRCTYSGMSTPQSFSGSIRYNDAKGVYESTSSGKSVAGKKSGSTLSFTTSVKDMRGNMSSTLTFSPSKASVAFQMVDSKSKKPSKGTVSFSKS